MAEDIWKQIVEFHVLLRYTIRIRYDMKIGVTEDHLFRAPLKRREICQGNVLSTLYKVQY